MECPGYAGPNTPWFGVCDFLSMEKAYPSHNRRVRANVFRLSEPDLQFA